jgi:cob(I)alamin adenosyltransferase
MDQQQKLPTQEDLSIREEYIVNLLKRIKELEAEIQKLADYILSISPAGIPEGSACDVAITIISQLRTALERIVGKPSSRGRRTVSELREIAMQALKKEKE